MFFWLFVSLICFCSSINLLFVVVIYLEFLFHVLYITLLSSSDDFHDRRLVRIGDDCLVCVGCKWIHLYLILCSLYVRYIVLMVFFLFGPCILDGNFGKLIYIYHFARMGLCCVFRVLFCLLCGLF